MDAIDAAFRSFRKHEPFDSERESSTDHEYERLVAARNIFLGAAHEVLVSNERQANVPLRPLRHGLNGL